jgi:hypothetical protein
MCVLLRTELEVVSQRWAVAIMRAAARAAAPRAGGCADSRARAAHYLHLAHANSFQACVMSMAIRQRLRNVYMSRGSLNGPGIRTRAHLAYSAPANAALLPMWCGDWLLC